MLSLSKIDEQVTKDSLLWKGKWFDVISASYGKATMDGLSINDNVVIMPYIVDDNGMLEKLGVMHECNPLRIPTFYNTLPTGDIDDNDTSPLDAAKRELLEETGYDIQDNERWDYLGNLMTSKVVRCYQPCYSVNITGIKPEKRKTDGTDNEQLSLFKLLPVGSALNTNDAYILSCFLKFFLSKYGSMFDIPEEL